MNDDLTIKYLLIKLFSHLSKRRKIELLFHLLLMIINSVAEVISLAVIIPFLSVLTNPEHLFQIKIVKSFSDFLQIEAPFELRLPITIFFRFNSYIFRVN